MYRALVISLALHVAVLLSPLFSDSPEAPSSSGDHGVLGATLRQPLVTNGIPVDVDTAPLQQGRAVSLSDKPMRTRTKSAASMPTVAADGASLNRGLDGKPALSTETSSVSAEGEREYRLNLSREARKFKRYPLLAREHGWEGVVVVAVVVSLVSTSPVVSLERSSGYDVLDRQALEMMQVAAKQAVLPAGMQGRRFGISLPVEYRLTD